MTAAGSHGAGPHTVEDLVAAARRPGLPEPCEIRVRPELHVRMLREAASESPRPSDAVDVVDGIPVVVDDELPAFPGYEVHRTGPSGERAA